MTNSKKSNFSQQTIIQLRSKLSSFIVKNKMISEANKGNYTDCKYYIAAPWFTPKDRDIMDYLIAEIDKYKEEHKCDVYFPIQHNESTAKDTFESNLKAINDADVVVAFIMSKDIGTAMEIGYAKALNKYLVIVVFDESCLYYKTNIMVAYAADIVIRLSDVIPMLIGAGVDTIKVENTWEGKE